MSHKKRTVHLSPFRKEVYFANNLRFAINLSGWTLKEAAKNLGVDYAWLRRAVTQGVHHTRKTNPSIEKLAAFFECPPELLWNPDHQFGSHVSDRLRVGRCLPKEFALLLDHYTGRVLPERLRVACRIISIYHQYMNRQVEPTEYDFAGVRDMIAEQLTPYANVVAIVARALQAQAKTYAEKISEEEAIQTAEVYVGQALKPDPPDPRPYRLAAELGLELFKVSWCEGDRFSGQALSDCLPSVDELAEEIAQARDYGKDVDGVLYLIQWFAQWKYCDLVNEQLGRKVEFPKSIRSFRSSVYRDPARRDPEEDAYDRITDLKQDGQLWEHPERE